MRLTLHITREQRIRLEQAAALGGQTLNDFIVDHACAGAEHVLRNAPPSTLPEQYALRLETPEPSAAASAAARAGAGANPPAEPGRSLWDDA